MDKLEIITIAKDEILQAIESIIDRKLKEYNREPETKFITKNDVVNRFGISLSTVNNRIKDKTFITYNIGARVYMKESEILQAVGKEGQDE